MSHQIQALQDFQKGAGTLGSTNYEGIDFTLLKDRIGQLHPETWKMRRERIMAHTHKIYEDNIKRNPLMTSHDLLSFIDRKLSNPMNKGELFIDMSKGGSEF